MLSGTREYENCIEDFIGERRRGHLGPIFTTKDKRETKGRPLKPEVERPLLIDLKKTWGRGIFLNRSKI